MSDHYVTCEECGYIYSTRFIGHMCAAAEPGVPPDDGFLLLELAARVSSLQRQLDEVTPEAPPTQAQLRRRIDRALLELSGCVSEPLAPGARWRALDAAMCMHLGGRALGMTTPERWHSLGDVELEVLCDAVEERAAIIAFCAYLP